MAIKSQDAYEAHRDGYDAAAADDARELKRLDREIILQLDAIERISYAATPTPTR